MQSSLVHTATRQDQLLRKAIAAVAPEWHGGDTAVTINKNVVCQPHVGKNNADYSYICFLGDFDGGDLLFEDGRVIKERYAWHRTDANNTLHWNTPITRGTKYSIVLYKRGDKTMHRAKRQKRPTQPLAFTTE